MPRKNPPLKKTLRIRVTPLPRAPTICGVRLNVVAPSQDTPSNRPVFTPTQDFVLAQLWTRHILNDNMPITTLGFESATASVLSSLNPQSNHHRFTSLQVRIRLNHLVQNYANTISNLLSARPSVLPDAAFSKFHTFYPFLACEKPVHAVKASQRGRKPWTNAAKFLTISLPRLPQIRPAPITFHPQSPSHAPSASSEFNVLDDILLLQYWHNKRLQTNPQFRSTAARALPTQLLRAFHTLHTVTRRHPRPKITAKDLHERLYFLLFNYVSVLHECDTTRSRSVSVTHTTFMHFAVVFRFLKGQHVIIHGASRSPTLPELAPVVSEPSEGPPRQGQRALRAERRSRMRLSTEQPSRKRVKTESETAAAASTGSAVADRSSKLALAVVDGGNKKLSVDTMPGWETEVEVAAEDESAEDKIEGEEDPEVVIVCEQSARQLASGYENRRQVLEKSVQLEELGVKRCELAVKKHELMLQRGMLELECSEVQEKKKRVEREEKDGWKWEKLREYAEVVESVKGNEELEIIAQTLITQFKSEIDEKKE
eukprot:GFKZ01013582.1.p1 GENE.GFKZ01013582.1~~GFKZ01013582.1.p1  ORF type:complete len:549 (+),score=92.37 GFKZ01013582.1:22-1647(+)